MSARPETNTTEIESRRDADEVGVEASTGIPVADDDRVDTGVCTMI